MRCLQVVAIGLALLLAAPAGLDAQEDPNNADGAYVVATDEGISNLDGGGRDLTFGDINTGGRRQEPIIVNSEPPADPAPAPAPAPANPAPAPPAPTSGEDGTLAPAEPAPADPGLAPAESAPVPAVPPAQNVTMSNEDGTATILDDGGAAPVAPAAAPVAASIPACSDFPGWLEAQVSYEEAGGTAGDAGMVASMDPDTDGIACEEMMTTS